MMVTCVDESQAIKLTESLMGCYEGVTVHTGGKVLDFIEMTFDFTVDGEVSVTMDNCVGDILSGAAESETLKLVGGLKPPATPASDNLFDIQGNGEKLGQIDAK